VKILLSVFLIFTALTNSFCLDLSPEFIRRSESQILKDLFSLNIGIMELKETGKINQINPLDTQNVLTSIRYILETVPSVDLNNRDSVIKGFNYFKSKQDEKTKANLSFLERKILYSDINVDKSLFYQFFLEMKNNKDFNPVSKLWFENYDNPFYKLNVYKEPIPRSLKEEKIICETLGTKEKGNIDFLIGGEIERIENYYFIKIFVYSYFKNKIISEFSFVTDSESIRTNINEKFKAVVSDVFLIKYSTLTINTNDEDVRIYLNDSYIGKKNVLIDFVPPASYVVTLKKDNYEDAIENIELKDYETKEFNFKIENKKQLQLINFYIEPLGSKIYLNSVYQGKSPFKKALPMGNYIISAKNDLYESLRYSLSIKDVSSDEKQIVFHLKTFDLKSFFSVKKTLYYTSFWNFTFSLVSFVPVAILATQFFQQYGAGLGNTAISIYNGLYVSSIILGAYTALSLSWLFFALADYIKIKEKKDFIPIFEYFRDNKGTEGLSLGANIKF